MPFPIPSYDETRDFLMAFGRALFPWANFGSQRSYHGRRAAFAAGAVTELHSHVDYVGRNLHPVTAGDGEPINTWGDATGVERKSATPARKAHAGRVRGAAGATVVSGAPVRDETSGLLFAINQAVTIPGVAGVDPGSYVDADIVGVDLGSQTRLVAGSVLKFVETPTGIEANVVLQLGLDEDGFDAEQFGSYRNRVLATFSQTPSGGNQADFVKWALASLNTVATAYAYPNRAGRGSIDVVAFYGAGGTARSLSDDDRAVVAAYIRTKAPFQVAGEGGALRVLETVADPQRVEIALTPDGAAYAFQWDDSAPLVVATWGGGAGHERDLQFTGDLPLSMRAGHSLILVGGTGRETLHDGREYKIESIAQLSPGVVVLEKVPPNAPAATDLAYSGGPLVKPVRDAIVAHLNGETVYAGRGLTPLAASAVASPIGLDILAEGIGSANPAGEYGSWSGAILRATLFGIAKYKRGARNVAIVTPSTDYEALDDPFPADDQIHYVTPGVVVVRRAW